MQTIHVTWNAGVAGGVGGAGGAHGADVVLHGYQLRVHGAHLRHEGPNELAEEAELTAELVAVAHGTAQHAAKHVIAALCAWRRAVGDREGQRPDVVCDDAVRHVEAVGVIRADLVGVRPRSCTHGRRAAMLASCSDTGVRWCYGSGYA